MRVVNVYDRGAKGDGVTDDTAAIQAALDEVKAAGGGIVNMPAGSYVLSSTLSLYGAFGVSVRGEGKHGQKDVTKLLTKGYVGDTWSSSAVIKFDRCRDCEVEHFSIIGQQQRMPKWGILFTQSPVSGTSPGICTHNRVADAHIYGALIGMQMGEQGTQNCELMIIDDVSFQGFGKNIVGSRGIVLASLQAKNQHITNSELNSLERGIEVIGGSFQSWGVNWTLNGTDLFLSHPTEAILVSGGQSENAERFLDSNASEPTPLFIYASRLEPNMVAADGLYFKSRLSGAVTLEACMFAEGVYTNAANIKFSAISAMNAIGCTFPNNDPFVGPPKSLVQLGCIYRDGTGQSNPMPNIIRPVATA